jgi:hypothetical protein
MKLGNRISKAELDAIHRRQLQAENGHKIQRKLYGPDEKPIRQRKINSASKAILLQTLVSKLYKDGFIKKDGDVFVIDASDKIEKTYGKGTTSEDIRSTLIQLVNGFYVSGTTVRVNGIELEGRTEGQDASDTESLKNAIGRILPITNSKEIIDGNSSE